jgi:hypothetical protein
LALHINVCGCGINIFYFTFTYTHPWVGGGPCLVNAVARRLNGGGSWVGELVGVADVMKG